MAKELNEDTSFKLSIKTIGIIAVGIAALVGGWYSLMQEIQEAKELPPVINVEVIKKEILEELPDVEITRMEFDMKDQMIRQTIINTQEDVTEIKGDIKRIEEKIDRLN